MDKHEVNELLNNLLDSVDELKNGIDTIKDELDDEEAAQDEHIEDGNVFHMSLADVDKLVCGKLSALVFKPGDVIYSGNLKFKIIDIGNMKPINSRPDEKHVLLRLEGFITDGTPFDRDGHNVWEFASIRSFLHDEVFKKLSAEEQAVVKFVKLHTGKNDAVTTDRVFLLSAKELGLVKDEAGETLPYFTGTDADEHRKYYDEEGDSRWYFTRSPLPGNAVSVRYVYTDGSLDSSYAHYGYGAVPACILI